MHIVPNSYGSLREFNACHSAQDGKFCSAPGSKAARGSGAKGSGRLAALSAQYRKDPEVAALADHIRKTAPTANERRFADLVAHAEITSARLMKNGDSKSQHTDPATGTYTKERQKKHAEILDELGKDVPIDQARPVAILMGGLTAAGKSTVAGTLNQKDKVVINADEMKEKLPGYNGKNASFLHEESGDLADMAFYKAVGLRQHLILDSTMKSLGTGGSYEEAAADGGLARKIADLKKAGYRVEIRFADVDVETSVRRSLNRFVQRELSKGDGRHVPHGIIRSNGDPQHGSKSRKTFEKVKHKVDAYLVMDTRKDGKARLIKKKGTLTEARSYLYNR